MKNILVMETKKDKEVVEDYIDTLKKAAERFGDIAKDVTALGGQQVHEFTTNTIAQRADNFKHIILQVLKEHSCDFDSRCNEILKEKNDANDKAYKLIIDILKEQEDRRMDFAHLDDEGELMNGAEWGIHCSGFSYWQDTDETHAIVTSIELRDEDSLYVTIKPDYGSPQSDWYEYLLVENVPFVHSMVCYLNDIKKHQ